MLALLRRAFFDFILISSGALEFSKVNLHNFMSHFVVISTVFSLGGDFADNVDVSDNWGVCDLAGQPKYGYVNQGENDDPK